MKKWSAYLKYSLFTALMSVSLSSYADKNDWRGIENAEISLVDAIDIAEKHLKGKAYEANFEEDSFTPEYEVDVTVDNKGYELTIDGITGEVKRVREDK